MIDSTSIQLRDVVRASLAEQMAAWEALNGPVHTLPIRVGGDKVVPFVISNPEKPKAEPKPRRAAVSRGGNMDAINTAKKRQSAERIATIRKMIAAGAKNKEIASALGIHRGSVIRLMNENSIRRAT